MKDKLALWIIGGGSAFASAMLFLDATQKEALILSVIFIVVTTAWDLSNKRNGKG